MRQGAAICTGVLLAVCLQPLAAQESTEPLWVSAAAAYRAGNLYKGHRDMKKLIELHPGDTELAVVCLEKMFRHARASWAGPWQRYAVERLCALERMGAISANSRIAQQVFEDYTKMQTERLDFFEVAEEVDRLAAANSHELYWRILQARGHEQIQSVETRPLHERLAVEMDVDHPDERLRELWISFAPNLERDPATLPGPAVGPLDGSPFPQMAPDDPDGHWFEVASRPARSIPKLIDRLAGEALRDNQVVLWKDSWGLTDPPRALDLHLLSQPKYQLGPLRKIQAVRFELELVSKNRSEAEVLELWRRYPWASGAQRLLLDEAARMLWAGRANSALRSYTEILDHAVETKLVGRAQVGRWTALAQLNRSDELERELAALDPKTDLPWMGKFSSVTDIRQDLRARLAEKTRSLAPILAELDVRIVRIPPVSPWPSDIPSPAVPVDLAIDRGELIVSARNLLAIYDTSESKIPLTPRWVRVRRHHLGEHRSHSSHPGYFRPTLAGDLLYIRRGMFSEPRGIGAVDRATGRPVWSSDSTASPERENRIHVPLGGPVLADGLLYFTELSVHAHIGNRWGRRLNLVCLDPRRHRRLWETPISEVGKVSDLYACFEQASMSPVIYGTRVTVHDGAIYTCSNAGVISRSDIRDGRNDWLYFYKRSRHGGRGPELGAAPIVVGKNLICMPRDAGRVIALDLRTGRVVWENPLVLPTESLGVFEDTLLVRGRRALVALDLASGKAVWHVPMPGATRGRALRIGASIYLASDSELRRLSAASGVTQEIRKWDLGDERPRSFTVGDRSIFVVTDRPAADTRSRFGGPIHASPVEDVSGDPAIRKVWTLRRNDAHLTFPPANSPLSGNCYLLAGGILECLESSRQGAIRWRRFVDMAGSKIQFAGTTLLVSRPDRRVAESTELMALDGASGRVLWEQTFALRIVTAIDQAGRQIFHDRRGTILAVDPARGGAIWERRFGSGDLRVSPGVSEGGKTHQLQVFFSTGSSARQLILDATDGRVVESHDVRIAGAHGATGSNGKALADGFFEIGFTPVEARYIRLVALSEINGQGWTSIAELEVSGPKGLSLPRDKWRAVHVDSQETRSRYRTSPECAFDDDPSTWWHTKWLGGIPRHPHEIQIDLGSEQKIQGLRYLPAVINNDNGMIRDYALYASNNATNWGKPVAEGVLVHRIRIENPHFVGGALVFEVRNYVDRSHEVFCYRLDGKPAQRIASNSRVNLVDARYIIVTTRLQGGKDVLVALKPGDPTYRFELGERQALDHGRDMRIVGDRLLFTRRKLIVADLVTKTFPIDPTPKKRRPRDRDGMVILDGEHHILKFVHGGNSGQFVYRVDLRDGSQVESRLPELIERLRQQYQAPWTGARQQSDKVFLLYDGSALTAWFRARVP